MTSSGIWLAHSFVFRIAHRALIPITQTIGLGTYPYPSTRSGTRGTRPFPFLGWRACCSKTRLPVVSDLSVGIWLLYGRSSDQRSSMTTDLMHTEYDYAITAAVFFFLYAAIQIPMSANRINAA